MGDRITKQHMRSRQTIETLLIIGAFALIVFGLSYIGRSHIVFLARPISKQVSHPSDAYALWKERAIHGRIAYLFDRDLNAVPGNYLSAPFSEDEFVDGYSVEALCDSIRSVGFGPIPPGAPCDLTILNKLLKTQLRPDVLTPEQRTNLTTEALRLIDITKGYPRNPNLLLPPQIDRIERLNRLLIEAAFPDACPKSEKFEISDENFVFAAIKRGYIRKIYHIIPDQTWAEVENNLQSFPNAYFRKGFYELPITEGVLVTIMRMRDIRPEQEPVIMTVNGNNWNGEEIRQITEMLRRSVLTSDLITYFGPIPPEGVRELSTYAR